MKNRWCAAAMAGFIMACSGGSSDSDANRVCEPTRSAAYWSREYMPPRLKLNRSPVRNACTPLCPPPTRWSRPSMMVHRLRCASSGFSNSGISKSVPVVFGKNAGACIPYSVPMQTSLCGSAARAAATRGAPKDIASSSGRPIETPVPRRNVRRLSFRERSDTWRLRVGLLQQGSSNPLA